MFERGTPFFQSLRSGGAGTLNVGAGERVYARGEEADALYVVLEGRVHLAGRRVQALPEAELPRALGGVAELVRDDQAERAHDAKAGDDADVDWDRHQLRKPKEEKRAWKPK